MKPWHAILLWSKQDDSWIASRGDFAIVITKTSPGLQAVVSYQGSPIFHGVSMREGDDGIKSLMRSATKMALYHGMPMSKAEEAIFGKLVTAARALDWKLGADGQRVRIAMPIIERTGHQVQVPDELKKG
jgi:hypothetical protein